jgi:hypothetical protein
MKKLLTLAMIFIALGSMLAQEDTAAKNRESPATKDAAPKQVATPVYKLAFVIYELNDGKKINQREYSLLVQADDRAANKLKTGTKVPIPTGSDKGNISYTYTDVGLVLECSAVETVNNKLAIRVDLELSNFTIPEQNTSSRTLENPPILRAITERVRTVLTPGKPQVITSMDDVNSNKRTQFEVTATRMD